MRRMQDKENTFDVRESDIEDYIRDFKKFCFRDVEIERIFRDLLSQESNVLDLYAETHAIPSLFQIFGNPAIRLHGLSVSNSRAEDRLQGLHAVEHLSVNLKREGPWKMLNRFSRHQHGFDLILSRGGGPIEALDHDSTVHMIHWIPRLLSERGVALLQLPPAWQCAQHGISLEAFAADTQSLGKDIYLKDNARFTTTLMGVPGTMAIIVPPSIRPAHPPDF